MRSMKGRESRPEFKPKIHKSIESDTAEHG
jgi:hypothetical protein